MHKHRLTNTPAPQTPAPELIPVQEPEPPESDKECSDEEDFELLIGFDPKKAKTRLFSLSNSITMAINTEQQRDIFVEVGVNVSNENPWKQISKKFLEDHLSSDTYEMSVLKEKLKEIEEDPMLLIGYVPHLSDETRDNFIIYLDEVTCKEASEIIKRLEACERRKITRSIVKYPRPYQSMGSEVSVDAHVRIKRTNIVDIELQSVYPMRYSDGNFKYRFSDDVRDGYAELLPDKKVNFENVHRKMIDRAVQSGASKVTEEQQTDPTFPTNAWSQYLYELEEAEKKADDAETLASVDEKKEEEISFMPRKKKEIIVEEVKPVEPVVSQQVEDLLQTLEFNQVDMYRDDYKFIGKEEVAKYNTPFLEELCCFANIAKCRGRHIISMDWHPEISGVCVAAYGYELMTKKVQNNDVVDVIKRAIIDANPILIWSFDDPLYPKLELESIREISCISFCPYDGNIIVGGTVNGQIVIWDLRNRFENMDTEVILSPAQQKHRNEIREYLKWNANAENSNSRIILPAVVSNIEKSHEMAVTGIKWFAQNYQCTRKGILKEDRQNNTKFRNFATTSLDGKLLFWDLDWVPSSEDSVKIEPVETKILFPIELNEEISPLKEKDKIFMPHFTLNIAKPITSFTFNEGQIGYDIKEKPSKFNLTARVLFKATSRKKESFNPKMVFGTSLGDLISISWDGDDFSNGAFLEVKTMITENFAAVHDGLIVSVQRNPFMTDSFISIGGNVFALWHDEYKLAPMFWRRCKSLITGVQWSLDRPSVFFLICENGTLEIWDLYTRIDVPSLEESLGGNILSHIEQHKLPISKRLLAVGDHNSNLRIFVVPTAFTQKHEDEEKFYRKFIEKEVKRRRDQDEWRVEWFNSNKDILDAKKDVEQQLIDEKEKKERIMRENEEKRAAMAEAEAKKLAKKKAKKLVYDLPEKLEKRWNEQNFKRLLKTMMDRKKVDKDLLEKQTKFLKDRMRFNEQKKVAIKQSIAKIDQDLSSIRSRLIPVEEYQATRDELVSETVNSIFSKPFDYKTIENESLDVVKAQKEMKPMTLADIYKRCRLNREILNQSLGGGAKAKFEKFQLERQQNQTNMSRFSSSMSLLPGMRSVTFSADFKDEAYPETPHPH